MDLAERIQRRRTGRTKDALVVDWDALSPAYHPPDPVGRSAVLESLLDALDPVFDDEVPADVYVWGPAGAGKSAIITALIRALDTEVADRQVRYTATRGRSAMPGLQYAYVDGYQAPTRFQLYRQLLDAIRREAVPHRGLSTEELLTDIRDAIDGGLVVGIDHLSMAGTLTYEEVCRYLEPLDGISVLAVGRNRPEDLTRSAPQACVHVPPYTHDLIEVLTVRGTRGLSQAMDHNHARHIADWAGGNAHDALAALSAAGLVAHEKGKNRLGADEIDLAMREIPRGGATMSHVLALNDTERSVLAEVIQVQNEADVDIDGMAARISERSDLTRKTVKRLLYELAQENVLERTEVTVSGTPAGRHPSQVKPNFSIRLFRHLRNQ